MNIIVIVADSLRTDHLGCYGSSVQTPHLDQLAADSTVFEQAYAENLPTMPCRTAWWTGQYLFTERGWQPFELSDYLLAEVLWDKGFTSAFITDVYHMHKPAFNCGRGFDTTTFIRGQEYDPWIVDESVEVDIDTYHRLRGDESDGRWRANFAQYMRNVSGFETEEDYFAARVVKEAVAWLEGVTQTQKDNLFLWVDLFDPHEPWDPPSPYREMYDPDYNGQALIDPVPGPVEGYMTEAELEHTRALYAGEVTYVDAWIGVLLDRMKDLGVYDNSLIVFMSDHGIVRKARPWNYEELAHIPWLMRHPDGLGHGQRISSFIQPPDLMPTLLAMLGLPRTLTLPYTGAERELTVRSLLPLLTGEVESIRDVAVTAHYGKQWSLRTAQWTYLYNLDGSSPELYDRQADPREQHDLWPANQAVGDALELRLRRFADTVRRSLI